MEQSIFIYTIVPSHSVPICVDLPARLSSAGQAALRATVRASGFNCSSVLHSRQKVGKFPSSASPPDSFGTQRDAGTRKRVLTWQRKLYHVVWYLKQAIMGSLKSPHFISKKNPARYVFLGYSNAVVLGESKAITEKTSFTFIKTHECQR